MDFNDDRKFKENFLKKFPRPRRNTRNQFSFNLKVCQRCLCLYSNLPAHLFNLTKCNKISHFAISYVSVRTRKRKQYSRFIKFKLIHHHLYQTNKLFQFHQIFQIFFLHHGYRWLSSSSPIASNISTTSDIFVYSLQPSLLLYWI